MLSFAYLLLDDFHLSISINFTVLVKNASMKERKNLISSQLVSGDASMLV